MDTVPRRIKGGGASLDDGTRKFTSPSGKHFTSVVNNNISFEYSLTAYISVCNSDHKRHTHTVIDSVVHKCRRSTLGRRYGIRFERTAFLTTPLKKCTRTEFYVFNNKITPTERERVKICSNSVLFTIS